MTTATGIKKSPTGIAGFDAITNGGLPTGRTTLIDGAPGAGKTVFALQTLVHGARDCGEPGIFVAFEENAQRIIANAGEFGWDLPDLQTNDLFFLNAQPSANLVQSGSFDLDGMLSALDAKVTAMGAKRIAFDALDIVLDLLDDVRDLRREVYRLHDWLLERNLTAIVTFKSGRMEPHGIPNRFDFMHYMVDCALALGNEVDGGVSQRWLRVLKYRGSGFEENEAPVIIGPQGVEVAYASSHGTESGQITTERVSSGVERLDTMLGGGYFRGAGILLTGSPGTAKTTLAGTFTEAACTRGERTLFISFDSSGAEVVRNLQSVGVDLAPFVEQKLLRIVSARSVQGSSEVHLMRIKEWTAAHACRCLVVDPVSALSKAGNREHARSVVERLIDWAKREGITLLFSSQLDHEHPELVGTPLEISTIADTWIHLSYLILAGERNRGLSIVKSRGMAHSNQVRELVLDHDGVTLADVYTAGGEVLMGSMRHQKEEEERQQRRIAQQDADHRLHGLLSDVADLEVQLKTIERALAHKRAEYAELGAEETAVRAEELAAHDDLHERRSGDAKQIME